MIEPDWLEQRDVLAIHQRQLALHGGLAGIRDAGMLESALNRPRNKFVYEDAGLEALAASYAFGIANNHPFVDGNKRAAFMAMSTFLEVNGRHFVATEVDVAATFLDLAAGKLTEEELTAWIAANSQ